MKNFIGLLLLILCVQIGFAQEQPCVEPKRSKYSTGPHPKTSPIFPGCESFKEENNSLNSCFGRKLSQLIAEKLDKKIVGEISESSVYYKNKLSILIETNGKLNFKLFNRLNTAFENKLVQKLNEISEEVVVRPAKYEGNYCATFTYSLPLTIELSEDEISSK